MREKALYLDRTMPYQELWPEDGVIQKLYEIRNGAKSEVLEVPSGCIDVRCLAGDGLFAVQIVGRGETARVSEVSRWERCVGVRLRPEILLDEEAKNDILGRAEELRAVMAGGVPLAEKLAPWQEMLKGRVKRVERPVSDILDEIEQKNGCILVEECVSALPYCIRYMEKRFKRAMGITIKRYADIAKFQHTLLRLEAEEPAFGDKMDYYDQAHFIHKFKAYTSVTPSQYKRERGKKWFV